MSRKLDSWNERPLIKQLKCHNPLFPLPEKNNQFNYLKETVVQTSESLMKCRKNLHMFSSSVKGVSNPI